MGTIKPAKIKTVDRKVSQYLSLIGKKGGKGLPAYTLEFSTGGLWRSRFDEPRHLIIINSGHRDFKYASQTASQKVRYICRLYTNGCYYARSAITVDDFRDYLSRINGSIQ